MINIINVISNFDLLKLISQLEKEKREDEYLILKSK